MSTDTPDLVILSSPSGAGKTTLSRRLLERFPAYTVSISHTTRRPRPGEEHGREYYFVDDAAFDAMVVADRFAEWAAVHTSRYGTSRAEIDRLLGAGRKIVFDIDWQGTEQLLRRYPDALTVFVLPPSLADLAARLRGRKTDDEAEIRVRLRNAREELGHYALYDHLICNDSLDAAFDDLVQRIQGLAPHRAQPGPADVRRLLSEEIP